MIQFTLSHCTMYNVLDKLRYLVYSRVVLQKGSNLSHRPQLVRIRLKWGGWVTPEGVAGIITLKSLLLHTIIIPGALHHYRLLFLI
jgi:hypothetical protein